MKYILIFLLICSASISKASNCLLLALSSFSNISDIERTKSAKRFWELYKNDPRFGAYVRNSLQGTDLEKKYLKMINENNPSLSTNTVIPSNRVTPELTLPLPELELSTKTIPIGDPTWPGPIDNLVNDSTLDLSSSSLSTLSNPMNPIIGNQTISTSTAIKNYELYKIESDVLEIAERYDKLPEEIKSTIEIITPQKHTLEISPAKTSFSATGAIVRTPAQNFSFDNRNLMTYEETISKIRSGDTLSFPSTKKIPEREFTVGKFLGAGNATHIYEISKGGSEANTLLRLPASADFVSNSPKEIIENRILSSDGRLIDQRSPDIQKYYPANEPIKTRLQNIYDKDYTSYRLSWQYVNKRAKSICDNAVGTFLNKPCYYTVKIISHDPNYRWVEVEKIDITQSYEVFRKNNFQVIEMVIQNKTNDEILKQFSGLGIDQLNEIRIKTERLQSVSILAKSSGATDFREAQLAWAKRPDTGQMDWILLDW